MKNVWKLSTLKIPPCVKVKISSSENNTKAGIAVRDAYCCKNLVCVTAGGWDFKHIYFFKEVYSDVLETLSTS